MNAREWGRWSRVVGQPGLRDVLHAHWDPIGPGVPADEHDCVEVPIGSLLFRGDGEVQVAALASEHRVGHFGADPDPEADGRAAAAIIAWYQAVRPRTAAVPLEWHRAQ